MVSHHHKCIFVHIPRTAGQSIERFFLHRLGLDWRRRAPLLLRHNDVPELGPPRLAHLQAMEYLRYKYITEEQFDRYFKFSFVRNPWDRLVSIYKHWNMHHVCDFKAFVMRKLKNGMYRKHYWFVCPQKVYLCDEAGGLLVDFVGRFERLQPDFSRVCGALGIDDSALPHVNEGGGQRVFHGSPRQVLDNILWQLYRKHRIPAPAGYRDYYDAETRQFVEELYAPDIEMFGYEFADSPA